MRAIAKCAEPSLFPTKFTGLRPARQDQANYPIERKVHNEIASLAKLTTQGINSSRKGLRFISKAVWNEKQASRIPLLV